ncbi:hypothetical protein AB0K00_32200 [Dactylosporangium sp. NPDC049525]|uniref:hypothetical protein n=1 Tax=Dactylosporangium sp. NPDC049525 TaxID=3154730 RepID=UPI003415E91A
MPQNPDEPRFEDYGEVDPALFTGADDPVRPPATAPHPGPAAAQVPHQRAPEPAAATGAPPDLDVERDLLFSEISG